MTVSTTNLHEINSKFSSAVQLYSNNRKEDVILTRLKIGHTRITHKQYILNEDQPVCIACYCPLTVKHILIECADTALTRENYFNCNDLTVLQATPF